MDPFCEVYHGYYFRFFHNIIMPSDFSPNFDFLFYDNEQSMSELIKRRKRLTEPEVRYYIIQLVSSLQYLHENLVIHRDLKLGNLFLDSHMRIKVGDFGLATRLSDASERRRTFCGTPNYIGMYSILLYSIFYFYSPCVTIFYSNKYSKIENNYIRLIIKFFNLIKFFTTIMQCSRFTNF